MPNHELETPKECMCCGELTDPADLKLNIEETEWLCPECINLSSCCGAKFDDDIRICPDCKEHC